MQVWSQAAWVELLGIRIKSISFDYGEDYVINHVKPLRQNLEYTKCIVDVTFLLLSSNVWGSHRRICEYTAQDLMLRVRVPFFGKVRL